MRRKIYCTSNNDNRQTAIKQWVNDVRKDYSDSGVGGANGSSYAFLGDDSYYLVGSVLDAAKELEPGNYDIDNDDDWKAIKITAKMRKEMDSWWS